MLAGTFVLALALAPALCAGATWTVTSTGDSGAGTLRALLAGAGSGDTINFAAALSGRDIILDSGVIVISNSVTIDASSLADGIGVGGNKSERVFHITAGTTAMTGLTIFNGNAGANNGGGILTEATLLLTNCTLTANSALNGGGVSVSVAGNATIRGCTFYNNAGSSRAGGLHVAGIARAMECTFSGNSAGSIGGGAVCVNSPLSPVATLDSCTISGNQCTNTGVGGGVYNVNGTITNINCIVAGNTTVASGAGSNIVGAFHFSGVQLLNVNPQLASLGNYGGPTQTMPPLAGSQAIDGATSGTGFTTDQRGYPRTQGADPDIGAVEAGNAIPGANYKVVTTTNDFLNGLTNSGVSLRSAVAFVPNNSIITFAPSLSGQTITLTNGEIAINQNLTIDASSLPSGITVSGNHTSRIFELPSATTNVLKGLTLINGLATGTYPANAGGAIYVNNNAVLTIQNSTLSSNSASFGGGIYNNLSTLTIQNSTISSNTAGVYGGGVYNNLSTLTILNSTLSSNRVFGVGGGGGGIYNNSFTLTIQNSTLSGNTANQGYGGGIYNITATNTILNSTVSGNTAAYQGGGIYNSPSSSTLLLMTNSIVAGNTQGIGTNISGTISAAVACLTNGTPLLAPLGNYGGPTQTMPPLPGSPAIEAGFNTGSLPATDQRGPGYPRVVGDLMDIGAVEAAIDPYVFSTADSGYGSLRYAANYATNNSTITFAPGLSGHPITLTSGYITLQKTVTIDASTLPGGITINGNQNSRIFLVNSAGPVVLDSLTIANGKTSAADPINPSGAGIYILGGAVTLNECTLSGNTSSGSGGGIANPNGTLILNQCTLSGNSAAGNGGGISFGAGGGTVSVNQCTLSGNSAANLGGGIYRAGSSFTVNNSVVAGNTQSSGNDISGTGTFSGVNLTNGTPLLAPLGHYGGPNQTMPPMFGSPAIDACTVGTGFSTDQRGKSRIVGAFADIGAVEGMFNPTFSLINVTKLGSGAFQFGFSNLSGPTYTVYASTDVAAPSDSWSKLGPAVETTPGTFQFIDPQATNYPQRFYQVQGP